MRKLSSEWVQAYFKLCYRVEFFFSCFFDILFFDLYVMGNVSTKYREREWEEGRVIKPRKELSLCQKIGWSIILLSFFLFLFLFFFF